ncbi:hypothetical protein [Nitrobacter hamburgensis]|uniref:hypothetical protein n=1 Tax=Nitrobacter hamburgensis TaxID=912 RepID=UPI00059BC79E|nr:hypothetical protein [Nitrobacter hamburgensis]
MGSQKVLRDFLARATEPVGREISQECALAIPQAKKPECQLRCDFRDSTEIWLKPNTTVLCYLQSVRYKLVQPRRSRKRTIYHTAGLDLSHQVRLMTDLRQDNSHIFFV